MISIITINLNNKEGLKETINSVISQTYKDIEYIIIDGCSTDGSVEVIKEYEDKISYWVSEVDKGIYNAMNKGIRASRGDYLLFLNSGDHIIENNVLEKVSQYLDGTDFVYGNEWKINDKNKGSRPYEAIYPDKLDESFFRRTSLPHQSTFIRRELLKDGYSEEYKIISDWLLFRESWKNGKTYKHVPVIVSVYDCSGFSYQNIGLMNDEKKQYYIKN